MSLLLNVFYNFIDDVNQTIASGGIHQINTNNITAIETALKNYESLKREYEFLREHYNELLHEYNSLKGKL